MTKPLASRHKVIPAVYILLRDGDKILILRRANTGYRDGYYALPSGHIEPRESALKAAIREAKEEVGVDINPKDLRLIHTMHRYSKVPEPHERIDLYFEATQWHGQPHNAEPSKCDEVSWVDLENLPAKIVPELKTSIDMIIKREPYSSFGF